MGIDEGVSGFGAVRGQAVAIAQLERALDRDQLHHTLLFVGPRGVGKGKTARLLARALHCKELPRRGCGKCSTCRRIETDLHAGLEWIVPEGAGGTIKTEVTRELASRLLLAPFEGDHHVVVFDPAEALDDRAISMLLKTFEEPRPGVVFVLLATSLDGLLPTILSRCATVRFGRLSDEDVAAVLDQALARALAKAPDDAVPDARRQLAIRLADGSPGVAVELALDESIDATHALLREAASAALRGPAAIFDGKASPLSTAFADATEGAETGRPSRERLAVMRASELWLLDLRERLRGRGGVPGIEAITNDKRAIVRATDTLAELQERLGRNANAKMALEAALLEIWEHTGDARP